jgi:hypothetical protein
VYGAGEYEVPLLHGRPGTEPDTVFLVDPRLQPPPPKTPIKPASGPQLPPRKVAPAPAAPSPAAFAHPSERTPCSPGAWACIRAP